MAEIVADLAGPFPMHRLLQGDVGSGKTVVALAALLGAVQGGHQGALMVPTEVLAEQHHAVRALLADCWADLDCAGRAAGRAAAHQPDTGRERAGCWPTWPAVTVDLVVGTHALLDRGGAVPARSAWW